MCRLTHRVCLSHGGNWLHLVAEEISPAHQLPLFMYLSRKGGSEGPSSQRHLLSILGASYLGLIHVEQVGGGLISLVTRQNPLMPQCRQIPGALGCDFSFFSEQG